MGGGMGYRKYIDRRICPSVAGPFHHHRQHRHHLRRFVILPRRGVDGWKRERKKKKTLARPTPIRLHALDTYARVPSQQLALLRVRTYVGYVCR